MPPHAPLLPDALRRSIALAGSTLLLAACTFASDPSQGFPSVQEQQVKAALRAAGSGTTDATSTRAAYAGRTYPTPPEPTAALRAVATTTASTVAGYTVLTLAPTGRRTDLRIVYAHGGAYVAELSPLHFDVLAEIIARTGATITVPLYPLAPEHTHRDALPFLEAVYRGVLDAGPASNLVMGGDSAGAALTLAQLMSYRDEGLALPAKVFLLSPWLDLTLSNPAARQIEAVDPTLSVDALVEEGRWWAGGDDPRAPTLSPLFGNVQGLPPMEIFFGTDEVFLPDGRAFATALGANVLHVTGPHSALPPGPASVHTHFEYAGAFHVFVMAPSTPEAQDCFDRLAAFLTAGR